VQQRHGLGGHQTELCHVVADLNGAPRELISNEGELLWAGQLTTWGTLARCDVKDQDRGTLGRHAIGSKPAANEPWIDIDLRFANQWADEESGLHYNLNRHYDPKSGQYASVDPLGPVEGGLRTHGYVGNPTTWIDPLGLNGCAVEVAITSRAARRQAMRDAGIPTSQQPMSQSRNASGREYSYEVSAPGGGTQRMSVQQQTMDRSHPGQPRWEAGRVKTDPLTGAARENNYGRPALTNDKSKVDY
jgi:RHS repeat-associated protein